MLKKSRNGSKKKIDKLFLKQTLSVSEMEANVDEERRKIGLPTIGNLERSVS